MNTLPINNFPNYSKNNSNLSFRGYYYEPPEQINRLTMYNDISESPHRFFSSESLKHALSNPDILGKEGFKNLGRRIFKDARLMEAESYVYFEDAKILQKKFKELNKVTPDFYKSTIKSRSGKVVQGAFRASDFGGDKDTIVGVDYSHDGSILKVKKYKNDKVQQVTYASQFNRTGKVNHVEFWEKGTPKKIEIGKRNLPSGIRKTDKLFEYDENGILTYSAMNVVERPDGSVEMSNYVYPGFSDVDPDNIQRYSIKRVENPDNTVTCTGLMVFKGKQYWCYIPEITFKKELENKPIFNSTLVEFDKKNIKYYSYY